ncbi:hypothetical protein GCM10009115_15590 [Sphingopyxis soli]|uniref:Uncharacterized protein n=1 Tax=Sphingopyxis soli TaxID=592051 RepID=A0ABP3XGQ8_9SPHN
MDVEDSDTFECVSPVRSGNGAYKTMLSNDERDLFENVANECFDRFGRAIAHLADAREDIVKQPLGQAEI